jgi:hypothetical protein
VTKCTEKSYSLKFDEKLTTELLFKVEAKFSLFKSPGNKGIFYTEILGGFKGFVY